MNFVCFVPFMFVIEKNKRVYYNKCEGTWCEKEMFAIERTNIIKNSLIKDGRVSVAQLSELLNVAEGTIRRDLEKLEQEGFLRRTHGGAVLCDTVPAEPMFDTAEQDTFLSARQEIADMVSHLINDGDSIMLTDGLTNRQIAKLLSKKNDLTVLTNDLAIAAEFSGGTNHVILLGGDLFGSAVYGQLTIDNMRVFAIQHLIVEADGVSPETGITVSSINKASLIQQARKCADQMILICLSQLFGVKSFCRAGALDTANRIVTDSGLEDRYKDQIFELDIPLYTSVDIYEA